MSHPARTGELARSIAAVLWVAILSTQCLAQAEPPHRVLEPERSDHEIESEHFALRWNDKDGVKLSTAERAAGLAELERIRAFYTGPLGFPAPYSDAAERFKADVWLSDQGWATGSGTHERQPAMWLHYGAFRDARTLAHEYAHGLQYSTRGFRDSPFVGWFWECHAEWMSFQVFPAGAGCSHALVDAPHLYYGSTRNRYCNWQFFEFIKDRYGAQTIHNLWLNAAKPGDPTQATEDPFLVLRRTMGWDQARLGDHFGEWARANVTWDYQQGDVLRAAYGSYDDREGGKRHRVARLNPVPEAKDTYRIPDYIAPQRYGYNLIRLHATSAARAIEIQFDGQVQAQPAVESLSGQFELEPTSLGDPASDWRYALVAVDAAGRQRASELGRGPRGQLHLEIKDGDTAHWLVVVATPKVHHSIFWDQIYYSIYRYPYSVRITGAAPESPAEATVPSDGAPHPHGGGFVAKTAKVSESAYVAPGARVLDRAVVTGKARIEGHARVGGSARVMDQAIVRGRGEVMGKAIVQDQAIVEDDAAIFGGRLRDSAQIGALTTLHGDRTDIGGSTIIRAVINPLHQLKLEGSAMLLGDLELHATPKRGVFYGFVTPEAAADPRHGANRTSPQPEVTAKQAP